MTGHAREEADAVVGLELGADDYMTKPFGLSELLASDPRGAPPGGAGGGASAPGREAGHATGSPAGSSTCGGAASLPPTARRITLTAGEFNLLAAFVKAPRQVLSREQLLAATRVHDEEVFDRSIDVQILRLRRKLEADPSDPRLIRTERGVGYRLAAPVEIL